MSEWYAVEDPIGRYARFEESADGSYHLEPVKVPEHIRKEREERIRQRERQKTAERNCLREKSLDRRGVAFLSFTMAACVLTCCVYLYMMMAVDRRVDEITALQEELEELTGSNDLLEARIRAGENIEDTAESAAEELGMVTAGSDQIEYYSVDGIDYMLQYSDID